MKQKQDTPAILKRDHPLRPTVKWLCYAGLLLLAYLLQTMPGFLTFFAAKPIWIVAVAVCVAMYEHVLPSAIFCGIAGLLWDISSDRLFGFNGMILLLCGVTISLLSIYYLHTKIINSLWFCFATLLIQGLLDYLFFFVLWRYAGAESVLWLRILPCMAFTLVIVAPVFYTTRRIAHLFHHAPRV